MQILELLAGLISLANLFFKAKAEGRAARFALAIDRIKQLEKATEDEIKAAEKARNSVSGDPDAGRM